MNKKELIKHFEEMEYVSTVQMGKKSFIDLIEQLDELQKPVVPQFVADWIEYCKNTGLTLKHALMLGEVYFYSYANQEDFTKLEEFLNIENNQELFARAWLDGYEVEEKRYTVKITKTDQYLYSRDNDFFFVTYVRPDDNPHNCHTRKELEEADFGWVFDCPGIEIEEVEE